MHDQLKGDVKRLHRWTRVAETLNLGVIVRKRNQAIDSLLDSTVQVYEEEREYVDQKLKQGEFEDAIDRLESLEQTYQELRDEVTVVEVRTEVDDYRAEIRALREQLDHWLAIRSECKTSLEDAKDVASTAQQQLDTDDHSFSTTDLTELSDTIDNLSRALRTINNGTDFRSVLSDDVTTLENRIKHTIQLLGLIHTIASCDEYINSARELLRDGQIERALEHVDDGKKRLSSLSQIPSTPESLDLAQQLERRNEALLELESEAHEEHRTRKIQNHLDKAENGLDTATEYLDDEATLSDLDVATSHLESAAHSIDTARGSAKHASDSENTRLEVLTDRLEDTEERVEHHRKSLELQSAIAAVVEQIESGVASSKEGSYPSANGHFGFAQQRLNDARGLADAVGGVDATERIERLEERLDRARANAVERRQLAKCWDLMERAENAVADGICSVEEDAYSEAVERFDEAITYLSDATQWAADSGLAEEWELKQRLEMVHEYRSEAESSLATYRNRLLSEVAQHLDRAEQLISKGHQQLDIEDASAANESWLTARDSLETASGFLSDSVLTDSELTSREELYSRYRAIESSHLDLRDAIEESGYDVSGLSRSKLIDALQELAVTIGESPRESFADVCGRYPLEDYLEMFGSWEGALQAANLEPIDHEARDRRVYSRVDILEAIAELSESLGRVPTKAEMNSQGAMSVTTVENRFGAWETAVSLAEEVEVDPYISREEAVLELTKISGIADAEAKTLYDAGFVSVTDLMRATMEDLTEVNAITNGIALRIKADVGDMNPKADN